MFKKETGVIIYVPPIHSIAETSQVTPTLLPHTLAFVACTDLARRRGVRAERAALWPLSNHLDTGGGVWPVEWRPMAT